MWGDHGSGKSQILTYLTMWAAECDWIVLPITHGREYVSGEAVLRHKDGLYLQENTARRLLMKFRNANYEKLKDFEVKQSLYGYCDMAGTHQEGLLTVPKRYIYERRTTSDAWKKFVIPEDQIQIDTRAEWMEEMWVGKKLREPQTLLEIVNAGIMDMHLATSALAECLI